MSAVLLVEYSSSSDEFSNGDDDSSSSLAQETVKRKRMAENVTQLVKKNKCENNEPSTSLLPLPTEVSNMFNTSQKDHQDDPTLHGGRIRSFAHERGNWASLVYIPYTFEYIDELAEELMGHLKPVATFHPIENLHISLSRTFVLRHHCIQPLADDMKEAVASSQRTVIRLSEAEFYCNDDCTRTFLGLKAHADGNSLESYVKLVDSCLSDYQLPSYYKNPSFHVSLLWCLNDVRAKFDESLIASLQAIVNKYFLDNTEASSFVADRFIFKTGNRQYSLSLGR